MPSILTYVKKNAINSALDKCRKWLLPFGLDIECEQTQLPDGLLGEYEHDSVFTKTVRVCPENIRKECGELCHDLDAGDAMRFLDNQLRLTIFHELGHALMNQIMDWYENIPEIHDYVESTLIDDYFDVFDDGNMTEEDLVEAFAGHFLHGRPDQLKSCFEKLDKFITQNNI